jgi:hypothetical protein
VWDYYQRVRCSLRNGCWRALLVVWFAPLLGGPFAAGFVAGAPAVAAQPIAV